MLFRSALEIRGYRKRLQIIASAIIQVIFSLLIIFKTEQPNLEEIIAEGCDSAHGHYLDSPLIDHFSAFAAAIVLAKTIAAPIVDYLLIVQMKKDPLYGAEDLQVFARICGLFGMIFSAVVGVILIQPSEENHGKQSAERFFWI